MEVLTLIVALSTVMWYVINRFRSEIWGEWACCKWLTIAVAAIAGFGLSFAYELDVIYALGLTEVASFAGKLITGFVLMSGSSAVAEIIKGVQGGEKVEVMMNRDEE